MKLPTAPKKQFHIGIYIFYLLLIIFVGIGVTFSRFATTVSGYDTVQMAVMQSDDSVTTTVNLSDIQPGEDRMFDFIVTNTKNGKISDIAQNYTITLDSIQNLPLTYTLTYNPNGASPVVYTINPEDSLPYTLQEEYTLPISTVQTDQWRLKVEWNLTSGHTASYNAELDYVVLQVSSKQKMTPYGV